MAQEWITNIKAICEKLVLNSINVPDNQQQEMHDHIHVDTLTDKDVEQILSGKTCADCGATGLCFFLHFILESLFKFIDRPRLG